MIELDTLAEELGEDVDTLLEWERYATGARRSGGNGKKRSTLRAAESAIGDWPAERIRFIARARAAGITERGVLERLAMEWEDRPADTFAIGVITFEWGERPRIWTIPTELELERLVATALTVVAITTSSRPRMVVV